MKWLERTTGLLLVTAGTGWVWLVDVDLWIWPDAAKTWVDAGDPPNCEEISRPINQLLLRWYGWLMLVECLTYHGILLAIVGHCRLMMMIQIFALFRIVNYVYIRFDSWVLLLGVDGVTDSPTMLFSICLLWLVNPAIDSLLTNCWQMLTIYLRWLFAAYSWRLSIKSSICKPGCLAFVPCWSFVTCWDGYIMVVLLLFSWLSCWWFCYPGTSSPIAGEQLVFSWSHTSEPPGSILVVIILVVSYINHYIIYH